MTENSQNEENTNKYAELGIELNDVIDDDFKYCLNGNISNIEFGYYYGINSNGIVIQNLDSSNDRIVKYNSKFFYGRDIELNMNIEDFVNNYAINYDNSSYFSYLSGISEDTIVTYSMDYDYYGLRALCKPEMCDWIDLEIGWYKNENDDWIRMSYDDIRKLESNEFDLSCSEILTITVDSNVYNNKNIDYFMIVYGSVEDYTNFNKK